MRTLAIKTTEDGAEQTHNVQYDDKPQCRFVRTGKEQGCHAVWCYYKQGRRVATIAIDIGNAESFALSKTNRLQRLWPARMEVMSSTDSKGVRHSEGNAFLTSGEEEDKDPLTIEPYFSADLFLHPEDDKHFNGSPLLKTEDRDWILTCDAAAIRESTIDIDGKTWRLVKWEPSPLDKNIILVAESDRSSMTFRIGFMTELSKDSEPFQRPPIALEVCDRQAYDQNPQRGWKAVYATRRRFNPKSEKWEDETPRFWCDRVVLEISTARAATGETPEAEPATPDMLTIRQAAEYARVSERTVGDWTKRTVGDGPMLLGMMKNGRIIRIPRSALDPYRKPQKARRAPRAKPQKRTARKPVKRKS